MGKRRYIFTSESVSEGHPDKICDQISDAILDAFLEQDENSRVAIECAVKDNFLLICGEITSKGKVDMESVARKAILSVGYNDDRYGFNGNTCQIDTRVSEQSPEIAQGVDERTIDGKEQGAGDQGIMFGYATNETPEFMPLPIILAHKLMKKRTELRKSGELFYIRPDGKAQVSVEYEDGKPVRVDSIVFSTQHDENVEYEKIKKDVIEKIIEPVCGNWIDGNTKYYINPTGKFVIGGPAGDSGVTGRKIIVDTYGGHGRHGGGAFCLSGDSLVNTERGLLKLKNLKACTKDLNVKTDISPAKAELWIDNGEMETIKLTTKDGYFIEGTKNQCLRVIDKNGDYLWRRMDELRESDWISIQKKNRFFGRGFDCSGFSFNHKKGTYRKNFFVFPDRLTEDYAFLMGLLIGDGNCMMGGGISICVCEEEQKKNVQGIYKKLFEREGKIFGHWAFFGGVELRAYLEYLGLEKHRSWQKKVPKSIFESPQEVTAAFLRGVFDTDGTVRKTGRNNNSLDIKLSTTSQELAKGVQQLLLNFGVVSNIQIVKNAGKVSEIGGRKIHSYRDLYNIRIKGAESIKIFGEKIGFGLSRKNDVLKSADLSLKTDKLMIPNQGARIKRLWNKLPSNVKQSDKFKIGRFARSHKGKATKELTYDKLKDFLDGYSPFFEKDSDFEYLRALYLMNHYYTKAKEMKTSFAPVYDLTVPGAHTFTANGFVVHNSGKDPSKVDRSGAYITRYIAKNIVASGLADKCEIQISYAIGVAEPVSILVNCFGTNKIEEEEIEKIVRESFPLKPAEIIKHLDLKRPIYHKTSTYGHFGRNDPDFKWENLDKADDLRKKYC